MVRRDIYSLVALVIAAVGLPAEAQFASSGPSDGSPVVGPHTVNAYQRDDGVAENAVGLTGPGALAWLQTYTVLPNNETITGIRVAFGAPDALNGRDVTAYLWSDPNQDGIPDDATVLASAAGTISGASAGIPGSPPFVLFDIPDTTLQVGRKFFLGAIVQSTLGTSEFPAAQDQTILPPARIGWAAFADTGLLNPNALPNVTDMSTVFGLSGNWLVRGDAVPGPQSSRSLLNDTFADGNRTSTNLPTDSPVWIGQSSGNGSNSVSPGAISYTLPSNSLKTWTYFTSDNSAPDGNQPHNSVTHLNTGESLAASMSFRLHGVTAANIGKNFRFGVFFDPTDARVQLNANNDDGPSGQWADSTGYAVQIPINSTSSGNNPIQLEKRTTSNGSLLGSAGAYTIAPMGGAAYAIQSDTDYTLQLVLDVVSSSQLDVTATLLQGSQVITSLTVSDLGVSFGGTAIPAGLLPGSQGIYADFDQLFFRNSDNLQATGLDITNFKVDLVPQPGVPEPTTCIVSVLTGLLWMVRRSYSTRGRRLCRTR